jgi:hypothetical protein
MRRCKIFALNQSCFAAAAASLMRARGEKFRQRDQKKSHTPVIGA